MQFSPQVVSTSTTPVAWQSVGSLAGTVLAGLNVEKSIDFGRPGKGLHEPQPKPNDQGAEPRNELAGVFVSDLTVLLGAS